MKHSNIHQLIEGYFEATLSEQEEVQLKQMLAETKEDTDDIREAKATMGLFATRRYTENAPGKSQTSWGKIKYAAIFAFGVLFDLFAEFGTPSSDNDITD